MQRRRRACGPHRDAHPDSLILREGDTVAVPVYLLDRDGDTLPGLPAALVALDTGIVGVERGRIWFRRAGRTVLGIFSAGFSAAVPVTAAVRYAAMAGGSYLRWCGITDHATLYCFPSGSLIGSPNDTLVAAEVPVDGAVREVALGGGHACLLTVDDRAYCWGTNSRGQLGDSTGLGGGRVRTPVPVMGLLFRTLAAGAEHTCGVTTEGAVHCWGWDWDGRLGDGDTVSGWQQPAPRPVAGGGSYRAVAAGEEHTCALDAGGGLWCWGSNQFGQLGIGLGDVRRSYTPVAVSSGPRFRAVTASGFRTCALAEDGTAYCWGMATFGALGSTGAQPCPELPGYTCRLSPTPVETTLRFDVLITAGGGWAVGAHTCGLTADGAVWCWGENRAGETGRGVTGQHAWPAHAAAGHRFSALALGHSYTCGLASDVVVRCWGASFGLAPAALPFQ